MGDGNMRLAGVKELKQQTMALLKETAKRDIIITAHGKPMAVLHHLTEADLSDYLVEHDPAFKTKIESAYADYLTHGGISGDAILAKLKRKRAARKV
jgi:antitoxin (DNA-binding transcriptional repressor) of toxin-antitoxin stability system